MMAKRPYEPDAFDLLGGAPLPGGTLEKDLARWQWWQDRGIPSESMADRLDAEAGVEAVGWRATYGLGTNREGKPVVGRVMNPETAASESEWEAGNIRLHEQQAETHAAWMEENLPPKESERSEGGNFTLRTTYGAPEPDLSRIPKYEDSAHSKESRRQANARRASDPSAQAEREIKRS